MPEAPTMYDINIDEFRPVTQQDSDRWGMQQQAVGAYLRGQDVLRLAFRRVCAGDAKLTTLLSAINTLEREIGNVGPGGGKLVAVLPNGATDAA
jgi:hypothetical protein